jgi:hypothetical protein
VMRFLDGVFIHFKSLHGEAPPHHCNHLLQFAGVLGSSSRILMYLASLLRALM